MSNKEELDKIIQEIETLDIYNRNDEIKSVKENWLGFLKDYTSRFESITEQEQLKINFIASMHYLKSIQSRSMQLYSETVLTLLKIVDLKNSDKFIK
jgi:hypothetical protein